MADKQKTVANTISLTGKGLHSGREVNMTIKPADPGYGYRFQRIDLENQPIIRGIAENVISTSRGTTLQENGGEVMTIEHLCAAMYGSGVDNAHIELDGPEVPIMDGSSKHFIEALNKVGTREQDADREYLNLTEKVVYRDEEKDIEICIYPDDHFSVDVHVDFNSKVLGCQFASLQNIDDFEKEISTCKTFVFLHELEFLAQNNLIKGGDLDNALVIVDRPMSQEQLDRLTTLFNKPKVEVLPEGYLNNTERTFQNEAARHKLLDVIGDLSLTGVRINGRVIAKKPGHHANTETAKILQTLVKKKHSKHIPPDYSPNGKIVFDIKAIKEILPHRPPFLLVDKITYMDEWVICGVKNVTMNEAYFIGHYPDEPIMPGVLQIEAMAQVGGILLMQKVPNPEEYVLYFLKIEKVKFKHKVVPGDTLNIRMQLLEPVKRGIALCSGEVYVGDSLVLEGHFMAQLAKKPK